ncbi:MAG: phosphate ABC transporter substrate-binding protein PstS [bacterium]|nr:phosphate ABC transporter substrate-binding protein PstS [bacterium]
MKKILVLCVCLFLFVSGPRASAKELLGAGATFPYPYYSKLFDTYHKEKGVRVNYQAIGSGGGIRQVLKKTVDFGGTDAFMKDSKIKEGAAAILHIPTCMGAVVVTYNLPGGPVLRMTADIIADIFSGKIKKWNNPRIASENPAEKLPDMNIVVVHRSDGSGTTYIFSDYLSKVSGAWKANVGAGKSLNWPCGLGAKGNPGIAGLVKQIPGAVGYVELVYAMSNKMPCATIKNKAGQYVQPSIESVSAAADVELPADTRLTITDTAAGEGYPISGFTWLIFYREQSYSGRDITKARCLADMLWWVVHEGQQLAEPLHYAPLSGEAVLKAETILKSMTFNGSPLLKNR